MEIIISNSGGKPIYEQITSQIKNMILTGALKEGDALPSMRLLAKELRISVITTKRAYDDLERDGFIESFTGKGSFVAKKNMELVREEQLKIAESHLKNAVETAKSSGISLEEVTRDPGCALRRRIRKMESIKLENVCKQYKDFALRDVSFTVPTGSIMGLIGENGAGKTTIIKLILNMIKRDAGNIRVLGMDNLEYERKIKSQVGVVLDRIGFNEQLRLKEVAAIMRAIFRGSWDDALFREYAEKFRLPQDKKIKEFSRGMGMKLSIAAALSHRPKLLILDEATSGLDPIIRSEILDEFLDFIQDEEHSVLISSHITSNLEKVADYITFIHDGKVAMSESKDKMLYEYGILKCGEELFQKVEQKDIAGYRKSSFGIEALVYDRESAARKYEDAIIDRATLEDIMLFTVKGEQK